jgi:hypothetical protein
VIGVACVTVIIAYKIGRYTEKESQPTERLPSAINTKQALSACAEGETITITGKMGIGTGGITDWLTVPGEAPPLTTTPLFQLTFPDGTIVTCAFSETDRAVYETWLGRNRPGRVLVVRGTYWRSTRELGDVVTDCTVLPNGFR